jgi:hypothetical protein
MNFLLCACLAFGQTLATVPFLPDQFSVFNIYCPTTSNRTLNFMLPDLNLQPVGVASASVQ